MNEIFLKLAYLAASVLFILGLRLLSSPRSAPRGNMVSAVGMLIAIVATLMANEIVSSAGIVAGLLAGGAIGTVLALRIEMTAMPQLVALFNGLGGGASALVAAGELMHPGRSVDTLKAVPVALGILIGAVTLTGSMVAFAKLQGLVPGGAIRSRLLILINGVTTLLTLLLCGALVGDPEALSIAAGLAAVSCVVGVLAVISIGGADMPVVIALLNALSGLAASATGFALNNDVLIISGSLVGASGVIL
ncbi:MAG: NAD(P)(+) transhydrogenase (Re/Si-specific) subunit beta, partial [Acidobacteriota bacterium]